MDRYWPKVGLRIIFVLLAILAGGVTGDTIALVIAVVWLHAPLNYPGFSSITLLYGVKNTAASAFLLLPFWLAVEFQANKKLEIPPKWPSLIFVLAFVICGSSEGISIFLQQLVQGGRYWVVLLILYAINILFACVVAYFPYRKWLKRRKEKDALDVF